MAVSAPRLSTQYGSDTSVRKNDHSCKKTRNAPRVPLTLKSEPWGSQTLMAGGLAPLGGLSVPSGSHRGAVGVLQALRRQHGHPQHPRWWLIQLPGTSRGLGRPLSAACRWSSAGRSGQAPPAQNRSRHAQSSAKWVMVRPGSTYGWSCPRTACGGRAGRRRSPSCQPARQSDEHNNGKEARGSVTRSKCWLVRRKRLGDERWAHTCRKTRPTRGQSRTLASPSKSSSRWGGSMNDT